MQVVVLGGAGQLGREVVRVLTAREHAVRAVVRRQPSPRLADGAEVTIADARHQAQVRAAIAGADAVVNAIGAGTLRRNDVESSTTAIAIAATRGAGVKRYIAMSAGMVALDWLLFRYVLRPLIFRNIVAEHLRVEQLVRASDLEWTIVRPPRLANGPAKGYVASLEPQARSFATPRSDVAAFIADVIEQRAYVRQAVFVASRR